MTGINFFGRRSTNPDSYGFSPKRNNLVDDENMRFGLYPGPLSQRNNAVLQFYEL
jgi:hypothetical protein